MIHCHITNLRELCFFIIYNCHTKYLLTLALRAMPSSSFGSYIIIEYQPDGSGYKYPLLIFKFFNDSMKNLRYLFSVYNCHTLKRPLTPSFFGTYSQDLRLYIIIEFWPDGSDWMARQICHNTVNITPSIFFNICKYHPCNIFKIFAKVYMGK